MMNLDDTNQQDFDYVLTLINQARNRVYAKANSELVLLYFNVGKIVSNKVNSGNWGENIVQSLSDFILSKFPNLSGFNRRGLYRMKQFFEEYTNDDFISTLSTFLESFEKQQSTFVSTVLAQL